MRIYLKNFDYNLPIHIISYQEMAEGIYCVQLSITNNITIVYLKNGRTKNFYSKDGIAWKTLNKNGTIPTTSIADQLFNIHFGFIPNTQGDDQEGALIAKMPGKVVKVLKKEGDKITKGESLIIIEAMKMENEIKANCSGSIEKIHVQAGQSINAGDALVSIEQNANWQKTSGIFFCHLKLWAPLYYPISRQDTKIIMNEQKSNSLITTSTDLTSYFFNELERINNSQSTPLNTHVIHYCSDLLSEFAQIHKLFDEKNDKYHEKVLGLSLLTANNLDSRARFKRIKEIADTSLMLCGYFVESIDRKILSLDYYRKIGVISYLELDKISPEYRNQQSFFKTLAITYDFITKTFQLLRATQSPQDNKGILNLIPSVNNFGS